MARSVRTDDDGADMTDGQGEGGRTVMVPPRWVPWTTTVICALTVLDAAYLTLEHFQGGKVNGCVMNSLINCTAVTNSIYSRFLGLPVSVLGLAWAAGMLVLCVPPAWRMASPWAGRLRLAGSVVGVAMVFYLVYRELFSIGKICEYCTVVHILSLALFFVIVFGMALAMPSDQPASAAERRPMPTRAARI